MGRVQFAASPEQETMIGIAPAFERRRVLLWAVMVGALALALTVLATVVRSNPNSGTELDLMLWIQDWSLPGLDTAMAEISAWTDTEGRVAAPLLAVALLLFSGRARHGWAFALAVGLVALAALAFDYGLGQVVERGRPLPQPTGSSFPSAHTFGSTVMFGFIAFLAVRHELRMSLRAPLVTLMLTLIVMVGLSRVFLSMHWPTDVAAGYLLGGILLLLLMPLHTLCMRVICRVPENRLSGAAVAG